ncbi:MAG TPA: Crp/Fnr family transcriptional regulator [Trichocoleus sp.]
MPLAFKQSLYDNNEPISHIYFLLNAVGSLITALPDGSTIEVGTVGNEGIIGLPVFLGVSQVPGTAICQVPGNAIQMRTEFFRQVVTPDTVLFSLLLRYTQALMYQISRSAACNQLHCVEERFCRWILMTHDRVRADQFPLTQEFASQMLGVRRASVSVAASVIQKAGLIRYRRGQMTILDRAGLESAACDCYRNIQMEYDRLIGGNNRPRKKAV